MSSGCKTVKISEVAEINPRRPREISNLPDDYQVTFVPMPAVNQVHGIIDAAETKPLGEVRRGFTYFAEGDLIFAKITPCMQNGKSAIARGLSNGLGFGSTEFHVIRPNDDKVLAEWLWYFVRQETFRLEGAHHFRGAVGQQRVPAEYIANTDIPLPPITEQHRIIARIKECMERVEEIERLRAEAIEAASSVYPSRCHDFFATDVLQENWNQIQIGDLATLIQYGYTQSASKSPVGPQFLRITDIQNHEVYWDRVPYCEADDKQTKKYKLAKDDILFARTGATTGKSYLIADEPPLSVFASYLIRLRIGHGRVSPRFIYHFFQSPAYWDQIRQNMRGGAQPNINSKVLASLKITMPDSLDEQRNVVDQLDQAFNLSMELSNLLKGQSEALGFMHESILRKAFAGEL